MKLGTLRFSPKHRAARSARDTLVAARLYRAQRLAEVQTIIHDGPCRWWAAAKPGEYGVIREEPPPRRRSWWERLTGGRTTIFYGER